MDLHPSPGSQVRAESCRTRTSWPSRSLLSLAWRGRWRTICGSVPVYQRRAAICCTRTYGLQIHCGVRLGWAGGDAAGLSGKSKLGNALAALTLLSRSSFPRRTHCCITGLAHRNRCAQLRRVAPLLGRLLAGLALATQAAGGKHAVPHQAWRARRHTMGAPSLAARTSAQSCRTRTP